MSQEESNEQTQLYTSTQDLANTQNTEPNQECVAKCYELQNEIFDASKNLMQADASAHKVAADNQMFAAEIKLLTARLSEAVRNLDKLSQDVKGSNQ